jgi:hypothetical protein
MSTIDNNWLTSGFAPPGGLAPFTPATVPSALPWTVQGATDNIATAPYQATPAADGYGPSPGNGYGQSTGGFGALFSQLLGSLSSLFANLGSMFGYSSGAGTPGQPQPGPGQTFFTNAAANSVGDPHESFGGTTNAGSTLDQKWNSMSSHPNLLDSNSFNGGYRVSTAVTAPNSQGITQNQSATVTTSGGATSVTLNQDGSYAVISNGQSLTLPTGQPQNLGNGETVTLNANKSLTIADQNANGGCITTTLASNGNGGVNVTNNANNVDLGGSLVGHADYLAGVPSAQPGAFNYASLEQGLGIT